MSTPGADEGMLDGALRELMQSWRSTSEGWRDGAREEFDRDHLRDLEWRARQAMKALGDLSVLCAEAIRRCE